METRVVVTVETLRKLEWEEQKVELQLRAIRQRKAAMACLLGEDDSGAQAASLPAQQVAPSAETSVPEAVLSFLQRRNRLLSGKQIRARMVEEGFDSSRFGDKNNYFYAVMSRLVTDGKVAKEDGKFKPAA